MHLRSSQQLLSLIDELKLHEAQILIRRTPESKSWLFSFSSCFFPPFKTHNPIITHNSEFRLGSASAPCDYRLVWPSSSVPVKQARLRHFCTRRPPLFLHFSRVSLQLSQCIIASICLRVCLQRVSVLLLNYSAVYTS